MQIAPQVTFHGFLNQNELNNLYRRTDLATLTSYSESFPLVLLEASDNLVPILSTDVGDIKMMIPDDNHGFVAKIGDIDSIAKQIKKAVNMNAEKLQEIAVNEKRYTENNFSVRNQLQSIESVYKKLLVE